MDSLVIKNTFWSWEGSGQNCLSRTSSAPGRLQSCNDATLHQGSGKAATDIVSATASVAEGWLEEFDPLETIPESSIPPVHAVVDETPVPVEWPRTDSENEDAGPRHSKTCKV